jgi:hypothetical protein
VIISLFCLSFWNWILKVFVGALYKLMKECHDIHWLAF